MKKSISIRACLAIALLVMLSPMNLPGQEPAVKNDDAEKQAQELAIRAVVEQFVSAYNAHDAKAVADLFLPQAQIVDEDDNTIQGRDNIQILFADVFEQQPETGITVDVESIRFIGTSLALEMGSTTTIPPAGQTPEVGRYSVLHILNDGKWSMGVVRDIPAEPTHRDHLEALAWLVGDWTPTETGWLIKATSVNNDGTTASATNHIEVTGLDRYVFQSVDRVSGNVLLPPVQVTVVRQPPPPQESEPIPAEK